MNTYKLSKKLHIDEDKIIAMCQVIKTSGIDDAQMQFMAQSALSHDILLEDIVDMLISLDVPLEQVKRVLTLYDTNGYLVALDSKTTSYNNTWQKCLVFCFWIGVWQIVYLFVDNSLLLAGPVDVLHALTMQLLRPEFLSIALSSFARIALGFLLSFVLGVILATLSYISNYFRMFVEPLMTFFRNVPVASFIILLLIWVGSARLTIYLALAIVTPLIYTSMLQGLFNVDKESLEMASSFRLGKLKKFLYIYKPAFMPFLISSSKISLGMSWKSGIMAEVLATPNPSIGKEMSIAQTFLNTPNLLAWTVVVMVLSVLFEKVFVALLTYISHPCASLLVKLNEGLEERIAINSNSSIEVRGLSKSFRNTSVLEDINFEFKAEHIYCLMAPSGSGKTTFLRILGGLEDKYKGVIVPRDIDCAYVFQEVRLIENLTAIENILLVLPYKTTIEEIKSNLLEILPEEALLRDVSTLSGGQRRRVAIVRAFMSISECVLLDEPFSGLDVKTKRQVATYIKKYADRRSVVLATHDVSDAELLDGQIIKLGDSDDK